MKLKEEGASKKFDEISIEGKYSTSREDLLEYIRPNRQLWI